MPPSSTCCRISSPASRLRSSRSSGVPMGRSDHCCGETASAFWEWAGSRRIRASRKGEHHAAERPCRGPQPLRRSVGSRLRSRRGDAHRLPPTASVRQRSPSRGVPSRRRQSRGGLNASGVRDDARGCRRFCSYPSCSGAASHRGVLASGQSSGGTAFSSRCHRIDPRLPHGTNLTRVLRSHVHRAGYRACHLDHRGCPVAAPSRRRLGESHVAMPTAVWARAPCRRGGRLAVRACCERSAEVAISDQAELAFGGRAHWPAVRLAAAPSVRVGGGDLETVVLTEAP
jgi:hypothetical protein